MTTFNDQIYKQSISSLFMLFGETCEGAIAVDNKSRVIWINEKYLDVLNLTNVNHVYGEPIEQVIPNCLLRAVVDSGNPILLDILDFEHQSFVVTRIPLRDENDHLIGAVGFVLYDTLDYMKPLISKYTKLRHEKEQAQRELAIQRKAKYAFNQIIGNSRPMLELKRQGRRASNEDTHCVIVGESGTGKELLAHAIHTGSARSSSPFVAINVTAIPENLLEAELFGTAPSADTEAASEGHKGKLQLAEGGTLFLDDVADMPLHLQAKLLHALQDQEVKTPGSNNLETLDVRIIAATSRDLNSMVERGEFYLDLYSSLKLLILNLPPLRERKRDIAELCEIFLDQIADQSGRQQRELSASALSRLSSYSWPGNIKELRDVLERTIAITDKQKLTGKDFNTVLPKPAKRLDTGEVSVRSLEDQLNELERNAILEVLELTSGKRAPAAKLLSISRASFYDKLAKHSIVSDS